MGGLRYLAVEALPEGWSADYFGNLVDFRIGRTPPRGQAEYWEGGTYPWVSIADMTPHGMVTETKERVSEAAHRKVFGQRLVPPGSLLMSFKLTIGRVARLGVPAYHNEAIISFLPKPGRVHAEFLAYYLASINYADYQDTAVKGQTLNKGKLEQLEIALPPITEQGQIATVLSTIRLAIKQQNDLAASASALRAVLLRRLFAQGMRGESRRHTAVGSVPASWDVRSIGSLSPEVQSGQTPVRSRRDFFDGAVRWVKTLDLNDGVVSHTDETLTVAGLAAIGAKVRPAGTVMVAMYGGAGTIGKCGVLGVPAATNQAVCCIAPNEAVFSSKYLMYYLTLLRPEWMKHATGTRKDPNISKAIVERMCVPLAPRDEQDEIVDSLDKATDKVHVHNRKQAVLSELFRTLLHQLMTAQLRVHDLDLSALEATAVAA